ncbi:type II toxin-antitoxin system RelE/ParE family toxin [Marinoscillum sp.]|uniref:type II toxin-antitoxin system RelE/ParE family toxin n=1 Tax=Marinoscillum sp. TaxID=2024838 RepID=UPI003BA9B49D
MSFEVKSITVFERLLKRYPSLKNELHDLIQKLKELPDQGTPLGSDCFKIRLAIKSKGKGKSGGGRVITCFKVEKESIFLLSIFDKSEQATISDKELKELLKLIPE